MQLNVFADASAAAAAAAKFIAARIGADSVIGVATGRTPLALYAELSKLEFEHPKAGFSLDEYLGVGAENSSSFAHYVRRNIEPAFDMRPGTIRVPAGDSPNPSTEASDFEQEVRTSGVDLQILGVGTNGHIAFNEPGSSIDSKTRVVELAEQTRIDNAPDFDGQMPTHAITQGIGTIMRAKTLCLIAFGSSKAAAFAKLVDGQPDPSWPVSFLATHPNLHVFVDEAAASQLAN